MDWSNPNLGIRGNERNVYLFFYFLFSLYANLWLNGPKEAHELPNHRFDEKLPSFVKRPDLYKWLTRYHDKYGQNVAVKYNCQVENVVFQNDDKFAVTWSESETAEYKTAIFDYVVVATGHFSVPNVPIFPGEDKFNGELIHSTDYRDGRLFQGKRILLIGGSHSTEDIALQCWKFGAKHTHITHRKPEPMGFKFPDGITEKDTFLKDFNENGVFFQDGTFEEYDVIIKCTGDL